MIDLNERAKEVHKANEKWWTNLETGERIVRNKGELLMLVVSEIAEAMEGERKNLMDDHLPHRKMAEVEMADAYIRLLDYAGGFDIDLPEGRYESPVVENVGESLLIITESVLDIYTGFSSNESNAIADAIDRIQDYCDKHGYDLEGAYQEKMAYNAVRADHQREARLKENGKKF